MNFEQQLIFLFSALGAINGLVLSCYILFLRKERRLSDYFLSSLLLMISIRIIKSTFLHFNKHLFDIFIQFGVAACLLIGPFLYLYTISMVKKEHQIKKTWWWHIVPFISLPFFFGYLFPFYDHRYEWNLFVEVIYKQWLVYVLLSGYLIRDLIKKVFRKNVKLSNHEIWLLNIFFGTFIIWMAYDLGNYTSYIVGALSFSFVFYISILLWIYKRANKDISIDPPIKYSNSNLSDEDIEKYTGKLRDMMEREKPYLNPSLTLSALASQVGITGKQLSQIINQTADRNYSRYIAALRVEEAKRLLALPKYDNLKISSVAYDSGFNSLSSFNACFKEETGITPIEYKKQLQ